MRRISLLLIAAAFLAAACTSRGSATSEKNKSGISGGSLPAPTPLVDANLSRGRPVAPMAAGGPSGDDGARYYRPTKNDGEISSLTLPEVTQRIVYDGTLDLSSPEFDKTEQQILALTASRSGHLASSNVQGTKGFRVGSWKVRVPVDQYSAFLRDAAALAEVRQVRSESQDVTGEFYDLEARISAKKTEEARLERLLTTATGNLQQILMVEQQVESVREEIEQMQGRKNLLANLSAFSTLTVNVSEVEVGKPVVQPEPPSFVGMIGSELSGSTRAIVVVGKGLILAAAAALPWLVLLAGFLGISLWMLRRLGSYLQRVHRRGAPAPAS